MGAKVRTKVTGCTVKSQIFVRYLFSYFRTFKFNTVWNFFLLWDPRISMWFCVEALKSTKISSYEPVSSQKYENGYRTKICNFTVTAWPFPQTPLDVYWFLVAHVFATSSCLSPQMRLVGTFSLRHRTSTKTRTPPPTLTAPGCLATARPTARCSSSITCTAKASDHWPWCWWQRIAVTWSGSRVQTGDGAGLLLGSISTHRRCSGYDSLRQEATTSTRCTQILRSTIFSLDRAPFPWLVRLSSWDADELWTLSFTEETFHVFWNRAFFAFSAACDQIYVYTLTMLIP